MSKTKSTIIFGLVIIAIAFYGGFKYGQSNSQNNNSSSIPGGLARRSSLRANEGVGGMIRGEIVKKDAQSITVALPTSGSQIIWYATSTDVQKTTKGTTEDLIVGQTVMINGSTNSDGSFTAQSIQLR